MFRKPSLYSKFFHFFNLHVVIYRVDIKLVDFSALWLNLALRFGPLVKIFGPPVFIYLALRIQPYGLHSFGSEGSDIEPDCIVGI